MKKGQITIGYAGQRIGFSGDERLLGHAERYSTIDYASIVAYAAKAAAVPESSIDMAMEALFDAMNYFVLNGHSVQIPNLGTFAIGVRVKSTETEAQFTAQFAQNLRAVNIRFLPDPELKAMISTTSLSTSVNEVGYEGEGVLAVRSVYFNANGQFLPVNAGLPYGLAYLSALVLGGSRLSEKYLGSAPMTIVFLDAQGNEHSQLFQGKGISLSYNEVRVDLKKVKAEHSDYVAIKSFVLKDADGNTVIERTLGNLPAGPAISAIAVNGNGIAVNGTVKFTADQEVKVKVYGMNLMQAEAIQCGADEVDTDSGNNNLLTFRYTPHTSGNYPISLMVEGAAVNTYNVSFGQAGGTSIVAITANGDPLRNGSTTNITAGNNYNIAIQGSGLADLTTANFILPNGTTLVIGSQSDTLIQATIQNAQSGDFKVKDADDNIIFAAALVAVQQTVTVTGYKTELEGSTKPMSQAVEADPDNGAFDAYLQGNDVDELVIGDFTGTGITNLTWDAENAQLSGRCTGSSGSVRIAYNNTTIGTLNVTKTTGGGGDDYDPNNH